MTDGEEKARAFRNFEDKFRRYSELHSDEGGSSSINLENRTARLEKAIKYQAEDFAAKTSAIYLRYRDAISLDIEEDKESLLKAYDLFKACLGLNETVGDKKTHLSSINIASPLTKNPLYQKEESFIYLQCWFCYEKGIADYVPVMRTSGKGFVLDFIEEELFKCTGEARKIQTFIKEHFYS